MKTFSNLFSRSSVFLSLGIIGLFVSPLAAQVIINEVDADTVGTDALEFIELYDGGVGNTDLTGLVLVVFNGSDDQSYNLGGHGNAVDLDGFSTDVNGYFVLGNTGVASADITFSNNSLQNGADAVALFTGDGTDFPNDTPVTTTNLIDAIVYDTNEGDDAGLLPLLNAAEPQVNEDGGGNKDTESNQRCPNGSGGGRNTSTYTQALPSPDAANTCAPPPPPVIINEVDADTAGTDALEFIELYDGGVGNTDLTGLVLVVFNGSDDQSYNLGGHANAVDLDGFSTDVNGYFVLGNAGIASADITFSNNTLQNGADAVAIFTGDGTDFPNDTPVTTTNLIDAIVYDTNEGDDAGLLPLLNAAEPQVNEGNAGNSSTDSNQRCPNGSGGGRNTSTYTQALPSPDAANTCAPPQSPVIINEVDADTAGTDALEFIELYDGGVGNTDLTGLVLVVFNGSDDQSYNLGGHANAVDLDGFSTDVNGYFVLGNAGIASADITFSNNTLQNGADAVALFSGDGTDFPNDTPVTTANLIDAIVYDTNEGDDAGLLPLLNAAEPQVNEDGGGNKDTESNQRCPNGSGGGRNTTTYTQAAPTPDADNGCPVVTPNWIINEFQADPAAGLPGDANGDGTREASEDEFVEIVNNSGGSLDISGWTLADSFSVRHTFPPGTVVLDQCSVLVFGGGTPTGFFGGSLVQIASTGLIGLNNGGDTITLDSGSVEAAHTYGSEGGNNQSLTLDPDITGTLPYVEHSSATGSGGTLFSPGTQIDGSQFAGCPPPPSPWVINEIQADPDAVNGDANGDGNPSTTQDEFVEIVNNTGGSVDISGWTLADLASTRHTFPPGDRGARSVQRSGLQRRQPHRHFRRLGGPDGIHWKLRS